MIAVSGTLIKSDVTQPAVEVAPIAPMSAPAYVPPTESVIPPNPLVAPAPDYQFSGEGGTPFGARPPAYVLPLYIQPPVLVDDITNYGGVTPPEKPAIHPPIIRPRPDGWEQNMPVPTGQQPTKPQIAPATDPVTGTPGPVSGTFQGFDLARIPFWAWLVGAAFLGSRLLR